MPGATPGPSEPPNPELPELDGEEAEEESSELLDISPDIPPLDEADALDHDDSNAVDLDIGLNIDQAAIAPADTSTTDLVLDIGELISATEEEAAEDGDDNGPRGFDISAGIPDLPDTERATDDEDGGDFGDLVEEDLPSLDADEEGYASDEGGRAWLDDELIEDDATPAISARPWTEKPLGFRLTHCEALAAGNGVLAAGGRELALIAADGSVSRSRAEGGAVGALAFEAGDGNELLSATRRGQLTRHVAGTAEACGDWRPIANVSESETVGVDLAQPSARLPRSVLMRTHTGKLVVSADFATTFSPSRVPGKVRALAPRSEPALVLCDTDFGRTLLRSDDSGSTWNRIPLSGAAISIARGEALKVAAAGQVLVVADEARGVAVSYDGGVQFARIPGSVGVTALAVGRHDGAWTVWFSLHNEARGEASLVLVRDGRAEVIANIDPGAERGEDASETVRVAALVWDERGNSLWAAGGFGVACFLPPPS